MDGFLRVENPDFDWADMSVDDGYEFAASVGSYPANDYGLYDMGGNVSEWGQDWFAHDYYTHSLVKNPQGPETGESRVLRGGSWIDITY